MTRNGFFARLRKIFSKRDLERIQQAYWLAKLVHKMQKRDGGGRYFEHPRRVACLLLDLGNRNADDLIIAFLHDVVEDGFVPKGVLENLFGVEIACALDRLSKLKPVFDDTSAVKDKIHMRDPEYYRAIGSACVRVMEVKCADRIDNLRTMASWPKTKQKRYVEKTEKYILPIAANVENKNFLEALEAELARAKKRLWV